MNGQDSSEASPAECQSSRGDPAWSELGVLEVGIERIHLRRASLPAGRSGLWTSNYASSCRLTQIDRSTEEEESVVDAQNSPVDDLDANLDLIVDVDFVTVDSRPPRSLLSDDNSEATPVAKSMSVESSMSSSSRNLAVASPAEAGQDWAEQDSPGLGSGRPARLPHRRESLPFNFPDRSRIESSLRLGRRESLPTDCSRTLSARDMLPELSIISMAPPSFAKKEKRVSQPNCVQPSTSVPSTGSIDQTSFGCVDEKENILSTATSSHLKTVSNLVDSNFEMSRLIPV